MTVAENGPETGDGRNGFDGKLQIADRRIGIVDLSSVTQVEERILG